MQPRARKDSGAQRVFDVLRQRISDHVLSPGSKLREAELSKEFGISRGRVREIFGALEQRGLIVRIPNKGAVVVRLDPKQVFDLFAVREMLEALAVRLATRVAPKGTWDDLVKRFHDPALEADLSGGNFEGYMAALDALRERTIRYADNALLQDMLNRIYDKAMVIARRVIILPHRWPIGLEYHRKLVNAMAAGEAETAEQLKREIIASASEALERYREFVL